MFSKRSHLKKQKQKFPLALYLFLSRMHFSVPLLKHCLWSVSALAFDPSLLHPTKQVSICIATLRPFLVQVCLIFILPTQCHTTSCVLPDPVWKSELLLLLVSVTPSSLVFFHIIGHCLTLLLVPCSACARVISEIGGKWEMVLSWKTQEEAEERQTQQADNLAVCSVASWC